MTRIEQLDTTTLQRDYCHTMYEAERVLASGRMIEWAELIDSVIMYQDELLSRGLDEGNLSGLWLSYRRLQQH